MTIACIWNIRLGSSGASAGLILRVPMMLAGALRASAHRFGSRAIHSNVAAMAQLKDWSRVDPATLSGSNPATLSNLGALVCGAPARAWAHPDTGGVAR